MNYVIIGNSAAAIGCVEGIRKLDKKGKITVISDEPYHTYSRPLISYYLTGKVPEERMIYRGKDFYTRNNVETMLGKKVLSIDIYKKCIKTDEGKEVCYDRLLIATGSKPRRLPVKGIDSPGVYSFINFDGAKRIKEAAKPGAKAIVIGAGPTGLKAAEALVMLEVEVIVVELAKRILGAMLDEEGAEIIGKRLESAGVQVITDDTIDEIADYEDGIAARLKSGAELKCDFIISAASVLPNMDVVLNSGVKTCKGVIVDECLRTSVEHIYAAGDVIEGTDIINNMQGILPILPLAYLQGETAGMNMAGGESKYPGGFVMNSISFFGLPVVSAGLIGMEGDDYETIRIFKPNESIYKKIVINSDNRIVGFIYVNEIERAGIITGLIKERIDVSLFKRDILNTNFGFISLTPEYREEKMMEGLVR